VTGITRGYLLNGRVRYDQPAKGFRSGIEPVLLAASIPARPGQRVLEGGIGAGAGLLCLLARVPGIEGVGIELDPAQAALARSNASGLDAITVLTGDIAAVEPEGPFDHAFANPPYHASTGTPSPDPTRATAKRAVPTLLRVWASALARPLRTRGTLTMIVPAAQLLTCLQAMEAADCKGDSVFPLWPKLGVPAKLVIIRGTKRGRAAPRLLPGLVLHEADGRFTPLAEAILRDGAPLAGFQTTIGSN
jgi:tRNA1(Val) A37 N6-methylase TrmN6